MGWADSPVRSVDERRVAQRAVGLALVVLLHLLLLAALLQAVIHPGRPMAAAREIILHFIPRAVPVPEPKPLPEVTRPLRGGTPPVVVPLPPITTAPAPDLRGLGQSLFGCSPDALATASPQQRSQCLNGLTRPGDGLAVAPHDHTKDPDRWANAIRERNAPPGRIPCTYIATTPVTGGAGGDHVPMVELVCLHKLLSH